jgi:hypothetical protein
MMYLACGFIIAAVVMALVLMVLAALDRRVLFEKLYYGVWAIWTIFGLLLSAILVSVHGSGLTVGVGLE